MADYPAMISFLHLQADPLAHLWLMIYVLFGFPVPPIQSESSLFKKMWRLLATPTSACRYGIHATLFMDRLIVFNSYTPTSRRNEEFDCHKSDHVAISTNFFNYDL
jgi:hypothetical protein